MFDFTELEGQGNFYDIERGTVTVPAKLGAYVVWSVKEDGNPRTISRIFGDDQQGILFFGCTYKRPLHERVKYFCKALVRVMHTARAIDIMTYIMRKKDFLSNRFG